MRLWLVDMLTRVWRPRIPRRVGLYEVMLYPLFGTIEWLRRHALIIAELERIRGEGERLVVLDFGGGDGALSRALRIYGRARDYDVITADIDPAAEMVLAPDGRLPIDDRSVDVVASSDVFEHIPPAARARWAAELLRVARRGQVHTFPADGGGGAWRSTWADRELDSWHRARFGVPERWTLEHLSGTEPTVEEMAGLFPGAEVHGFANVYQWLELMRQQLGRRSLFGRLRFAIHLMKTYRDLDDGQPWKAALVVRREVTDEAGAAVPFRSSADQ